MSSLIYIDAILDDSGKFLDSIATHRLRLQGSKLVIITNSQLDALTQFGAWFGRSAEVNDPSHVTSDEEKKRLSELKKTIPRKSDRRVVQINLDPLITAVQEKVRNALRRLAELTPGTGADMCTAIALEFIESKERVRHLTDFDPLMDHWLSFVVRDGAIEWRKPSIRIPSSIINTLSCNKYILGGPGAGKTTLLRHLARELARSSDGVLPVFLPLLLVKEPTRNALIETCVRQLEDQGYVLGGGKKAIDVFLKKAARGEFQLFLDGLDEIGSDAVALLKVIEEFAQHCPKLRIVLSCRSTSDIPPFKGALELQMTPFSKEQLSEFLDKWFSSQPTAAADLRSWLKSNEKMRDAATNPLIAALLCSLFYLGAEMPTTEAELYERRFELLLGKWDQVKGICRLNTDLVKRCWKFISDLAFTMHQRELRVIAVSEADEIARNYFSRTYHGDPNGMIRDCVHRGVLEYESLGGLSFGHLTYQEYLVARKIAQDNDVGFVLQHIGSPWWNNVIRFYASYKEDISSLIRSVLDSDHSLNVLKELEQLLELAPWTDKYFIREMHQAADLLSEGSEEYYNDYEKIVQRELRKGQDDIGCHEIR